MAKKNAEQQMAEQRESNYLAVRRGLWVAVLGSVALLGLVWAGLRLQDFLIQDPQFTVALPPEPGEQSPSLTIAGLKYSSRERLTGLFEGDYGKSLYSLPLRQRRLDVLGLRWVRTARVTRIWPNRIHVPVAFVTLPGEDTPAVLDTEGAILRQETNLTLRLPVAVGVTLEPARAADRRVQASRVVKLMRDAGPLAEQISEVDVSDPENLRVLQEVQGKAVILNIGNRGFRRRLEKFKQNAAEILRRDPERSYFDLRKDRSIYARPLSGVAAAAAEAPEE
jgi:cell division protein FtsQ